MPVDVIAWLQGLPPVVIYGIVFIVVCVESLGVPLPGELVLMSMALFASQGYVDPSLVWIAGATAAIVGDSIGYSLGRHYGHRLLDRFARWFPRHINPHTISFAKEAFHLHGIKVVFFGRFVALLRIFAGPLAGILRLPYYKFLIANALGGIIWSGTAVWSVYFLGIAAEHWLKRLSWVAFLVAAIIGIFVSLRFKRYIDEYIEKSDSTSRT